MATTPDLIECAGGSRPADARLPIDPWRSLAVHFGMLLGVDDFQTLGAYPRGKMWLHAAWLHGEGVVWGLAPSLLDERGELRLEPGLALDACGRELHLDRPACIDLGKWFSARAPQLLAELGPIDAPNPAPKFGLTWTEEGAVSLDAHVRVRFVACLDRQVPALVEPCAGAGQTSAYSRIVETLELELVPGLPDPEPAEVLNYPRLRRLFGLDDPTLDPEIVLARESIATLPLGEQPAAFELEFRRFAALDAAELEPALLADGSTRGLLPAADPAWFVLAELVELTLRPTNPEPSSEPSAWAFDSLTSLDWQTRPTHVATRPLEDLLAATLAGSPALASTNLGPQVVRDSVQISDDALEFRTTLPLAPESVAGAMSLHAYVSGVGWKALTIHELTFAEDDAHVRAAHDPTPTGTSFVRLRIEGTGSTPMISPDGWPLAGADDEPAPANHTGRDFSHMQPRGA